MPISGRHGAALALGGWSALCLFTGLAHGQSGRSRPAKSLSAPPHPAPAARGGLTPKDTRVFEARFEKEIWPLLQRANGGCVSCHAKQNPSQLHFSPDGARANLAKLLRHGFFEPDNPAGILARVASTDARTRMPPPPAAPWNEREVQLLRAFVRDLYDRGHASGGKADEQFPAELALPFRDQVHDAGPDTTFLTYTQLRSKIQTLFGDDWKRGERDLFLENLAQFNGADFQRRFDESTKASAPFLSALDALAQDAASNAYLSGSGPFAGKRERLPSPLAMGKPDAAYRTEITRLYRRLLFRKPSEKEIQTAFGLVKTIYGSTARAAGRDTFLDFELKVEDESGRTTTQAIRLPVTDEPLGVSQEFLDQTPSGEKPQVAGKLAGTFAFKPGAAGQQLRISNAGTSGNVSLAGIELKGPLPESAVKQIPVTAPGVALLGAWQRRDQDGFTSYEDGNDNKGSSHIEIPISVEKAGRYEVSVLWRKPGQAQTRRRRRAPQENAAAVPVEVYSQDSSRLANPQLPPLPPPGEAHFFIDQTLDTTAYQELNAGFRFGAAPDQGVEIRNENTRRRVVADSVKFAPLSGSGGEFVLDDPQAEGGWPKFEFPSFRPYNLVGGGALSDNNEKKGEMRLLYRPSKGAAWQAGTLYRVAVGYPGQVDNDTRVPVVVRAAESTPIVRVSAPLHADQGSLVLLDASATYNLQRSPLKFTWRQVGGPRVRFSDPHLPKLSFRVERMGPQQAAWEGLCRALVKHPDFLFTRPRSLAWVKEPLDRRRLQLVKIAQDLVGRPPTEAEVGLLEKGGSLRQMIDRYLESEEFRKFYFHRVRLVLESRGTAEDDEPARLWSYLAFNNRPFKELLTADYTVDEALRKQPRPAHHGKTGLLTMKGFIKGKPGLPHFNYAALVTEKFLGYVYEVPPSIVMMREGITAAATTAPDSACFSCHRILTPLAYQRMAWDDEGNYRPMEDGKPVDDTDRGLVPSYPYRGKGLEAFALQAVHKERFIRTIFQTHFVWYFGREMRYAEDERGLYRRLWENAHRSGFSLKSMLRCLMTSPEYLG